MAETKNLLEALADMYNDTVTEIDEKQGTSELFKECGDAIIKAITDASFTVTDIRYLDGYFIFGSGTNSVLHFHVDECPGWKFGVWFELNDENKSRISYTWFAQYERFIDKFKPTASAIKGDGSFIHGESGLSTYAFDLGIAAQMRFIRDYPALAFCRDYCYWDYNSQYHSLEEAQAKFDEAIHQQDLEDQYIAESDAEIKAFLEDKVCPLFDATVEVRNDMFPKFEIVASAEKNEIEEPGFYDLAAFRDVRDGQEVDVMKTIIDELNAIKNKWDAKFREIDSCFFMPVDYDIYMRSDK